MTVDELALVRMREQRANDPVYLRHQSEDMEPLRPCSCGEMQLRTSQWTGDVFTERSDDTTWRHSLDGCRRIK